MKKLIFILLCMSPFFLKADDDDMLLMKLKKKASDSREVIRELHRLNNRPISVTQLEQVSLHYRLLDHITECSVKPTWPLSTYVEEMAELTMPFSIYANLMAGLTKSTPAPLEIFLTLAHPPLISVLGRTFRISKYLVYAKL